MNICVVGRKGGWSTERLSEALSKKGASGTIIELSVDQSHDFDGFDGCVLKKITPDTLDLLERLEGQGRRFFSRPSSLRRMVSRQDCTQHLLDNNIPMPPTFIAGSIDDAVEWSASRLPVVVKPLYGSKSRGMVLLQEASTLRADLLKHVGVRGDMIYLQQKLDLAGRDYALAFLGGDYVGAYARVSDGTTWHTSVDESGRYEGFEPPQELVDMAYKAHEVFGLDFACVDVAISREVGPVIFEVSAFGGFGGLYNGCGIDAADLLSDYVIGALRDQ